MTLYDEIGQGYGNYRRADPLLVSSLVTLASDLGVNGGETLVDVGAGTGNYSRALADAGFAVKAVEPSARMREQALPHASVEYLSGDAESIPLPSASAEVAVCVLALHHVPNLRDALGEIDRVTNSGVFLIAVVDPRLAEKYWLQDYFPEISRANEERVCTLARLKATLQETCGRAVCERSVPVPRDYGDLFCGANWSRPELFFDAAYRASSSSFARVSPARLQASLARLERDLSNGSYRQRYETLEHRRELDVGLRLLGIARRSQ